MSEVSGERSEQADEVIQTVRAVAATMQTIDNSLKAIESFGRRTRQIAIALVVSLALDVALTVVVGLLSYNAFASTNTVRSVQYSECVSANEMRADQVRLWDFFINLADSQPPSIDQTPAQKEAARKAVVNLEKFVDQTFAQRPCNM